LLILDITDNGTIKELENEVAISKATQAISEPIKIKSNHVIEISNPEEVEATLAIRHVTESFVSLLQNKLKSILNPSLASLTSKVSEAIIEHESMYTTIITKYTGTRALRDASMIARAQLGVVLESQYRRLLNLYGSASKTNFERSMTRVTPDSHLKSKLDKLAKTIHDKFATSATTLQTGRY
jgi:hypothetical protein